jgi:hypothetical protein
MVDSTQQFVRKPPRAIVLMPRARNHDRYAAYQQKTTRPIPVVAITPS